jgi:hypothetical protein
MAKAIHELKVNPQFWRPLTSGLKPFELRRNDRNFKVGDTLRFREYSHDIGYIDRGVYVDKFVSYVLYPEDCPGLEAGYVILGIRDSVWKSLS